MWLLSAASLWRQAAACRCCLFSSLPEQQAHPLLSSGCDPTCLFYPCCSLPLGLQIVAGEGVQLQA